MATIAPLRTRYTPDEYLERERAATHKSEYAQGEIVAMAGAAPEHNVIVANLIQQFLNCLDDTDCTVYPSDMRVWVPAVQVYTYPDVVLTCEEPLFEDARRDNLLNPLLIVEVLSESTADYDRGRKFENYKSIASLQEYVLVWQDQPRVEAYRRVAEEDWRPAEAHGLDTEITLTAVACKLSLNRVYRRVAFPFAATLAEP